MCSEPPHWAPEWSAARWWTRTIWASGRPNWPPAFWAARTRSQCPSKSTRRALNWRTGARCNAGTSRKAWSPQIAVCVTARSHCGNSIRILSAISLCVFLAQAVTIAGLLTQRRQRRLAEIEVLNQRTELAHVARVSMMGQLASALAHELNQPLGAILRNAGTAKCSAKRKS